MGRASGRDGHGSVGPLLTRGAWVPTSVRVTLPDATDSFSVTWPRGSVDNCQGGATHPGTYVGPVQAGA